MPRLLSGDWSAEPAMHIDKTLAIVAALADGRDPATGQPLAATDTCQQPDVIRALARARDLVEHAVRRERALQRSRLSLPSNTGKSWTDEEDRALVQRFRTGASIADMATLHARTPGSIQARLEKLGHAGENQQDDEGGRVHPRPHRRSAGP